jgi:hypothetical protein
MATLTPARVEHNPVEFATTLSHDEKRIDAYHDDEPLRYRTMENLLGDQPVSGLVPHDLEAQLHLACDDSESRSFVEAERHAAWRAAMQSEMDAVEKNRTWELADLPRGHSAITLKWVFKLKRDEVGAIVKHKAHVISCSGKGSTSKIPSPPWQGWNSCDYFYAGYPGRLACSSHVCQVDVS